MSFRQFTRLLRVVFYARMSTDEQAASIDQQERWAEGFKVARNLEIVGRFQDPGISGNDPNRPDFLRLSHPGKVMHGVTEERQQHDWLTSGLATQAQRALL